MRIFIIFHHGRFTLASKGKENIDNIDYRNYMSLLSKNYQRIYNFILLLVSNHNNADDIMQETSILMFEKFNCFEQGTDFLAWAKTIARYKTLEYLRKQKSDKMVFNPDILELIEQDYEKHFSQRDDMVDKLRKCVSVLPHVDRQLLGLRYYEDISAVDIAKRFGCSFQKIYRDISRINSTLLHCIKHKIRMEELSAE